MQKAQELMEEMSSYLDIHDAKRCACADPL